MRETYGTVGGVGWHNGSDPDGAGTRKRDAGASADTPLSMAMITTGLGKGDKATQRSELLQSHFGWCKVGLVYGS